MDAVPCTSQSECICHWLQWSPLATSAGCTCMGCPPYGLSAMQHELSCCPANLGERARPSSYRLLQRSIQAVTLRVSPVRTTSVHACMEVKEGPGRWMMYMSAEMPCN